MLIHFFPIILLDHCYGWILGTPEMPGKKIIGLYLPNPSEFKYPVPQKTFP